MSIQIKVDFSKRTGKKVRPLHGFNAGPVTKVFTYDARPLFVEGGFPYVRLHDVEYPYGSGEFVDIPCVFKNFDADETDPANYNFGNTDEYIRQCLSVGSKIIYRLGVSIEHSPVKRYTDPPKDFAKWARICEHVIRHYNEGWADGYHWNIEYWEIWNEADLTKKGAMWSGTPEEFYEFYCVAATHLKSCFPDLKIGGCGWACSKGDYIPNFLRYIAEKEVRIPLDFHSWHIYKSSPDGFVKRANEQRALLDQYGYHDAESILDEWNLIYSWDFEGQAASYPAMKDHRGASFYAGVLCALQEQTDVTLATNFEADVVKEYCGVFDVEKMCVGGLSSNGKMMAQLKPTKGFYAFKCFNSLYRMQNSVAISCDNEGVFATAAAGDHGNGMLISNQSGEHTEAVLELCGVQGEIVVRLTDAARTNEVLVRLSTDGALKLTLPMAPDAFAYVGTDLPDPTPTYQ